MDKVWGEREGLCAWCNDLSKTSYVGEQAGGEEVDYQVCLPCYKEREGEMSEDTIISCLSNDLFVEPNLIVEEIMTASNLKASLRLAVEDFANYPMLLEKLASKF